MPLQNRVTPDAQIVCEHWRGDFMGNRGGRIHDPRTKTLLKRRWASKRWIICVTQFKQRQRELMGNSYTELFFLDEVSALAQDIDLVLNVGEAMQKLLEPHGFQLMANLRVALQMPWISCCMKNELVYASLFRKRRLNNYQMAQ